MRLIILVLSVLSVSCPAANLVPNSSFELSAARGWFSFRTSASDFLGNISTIGGLRTNGAVHGGYAMLMPNGSAMYSRALWLTSGVYAVTFSAKTYAGIQGPYYAGLMNGNDLSTTLPPNIGNFTGSWARYTNSFTADSNAFYWLKFGNGQTYIAIDAVQVEPVSATAYAPQATVEMGITIPGTNNLAFAGDAPSFTLNFWNQGSAATTRYGYQVFDVWNSNIVSRQGLFTMPAATNSSTNIALPARTGWFRIVSRLLEVNESYDELSMCVYPFASNITANATNDWLGGHPNGDVFHARRELLVGRKWARTLSPNYLNTRWDIVEPTRGSLTYFDSYLTNQAAVMNVIACLTPTDGYWPTWATNADGTADLMAWSNFCYQTTFRFKQFVKYWEVGPNEPFQSGPYGDPSAYTPNDADFITYSWTNKPINVRFATNYAKVLSYGVAGITNADVTAKIIAIAGAFGAGDWAMEAWNSLTANIQGWISAISTHIYPQDQGTNPNDSEAAQSHFSNPFGWMEKFGNIRPVWNTESGVYTSAGGTLKGLNGAFPLSFNIQTPFNGYDEALRAKPQSQQLDFTQQILSQALRCIGAGMAKYIYYDTRMFNDPAFTDTTPYAPDYQQVDRADIVSLSVATHFVRKGFGVITNPVSLYLEMYAFTNASGQAVVSGWNADRTNRSITLSNSFFAVYDCMGNLTQTNNAVVKLTRIPQYFVSGSLTLNQLSNTFGFGVATDAPDVLPPQVSFDIAPSGPWSGDTNRTLVKWTGIDDTWVAWATNGVNAPSATNVVFKWRLDNGSYTDYSQSNHAWLSNLSPGNHTLYVTSSDRVGNSQEFIYYFDPPPVVINISGTANVGTITTP